MRLIVAGLLALGLSLPLAGTAHAAPATKMSKSAPKMAAKPMRDPKTGRFLPKSAMASTKTLPMRDPKTGRFLKKGALTSSKMAPKKMPMRDAKGHFLKNPPQVTHKM